MATTNINSAPTPQLFSKKAGGSPPPGNLILFADGTGIAFADGTDLAFA